MRERVRVRGTSGLCSTVAPSSGLRPPSPSGRRDLREISSNQVICSWQEYSYKEKGGLKFNAVSNFLMCISGGNGNNLFLVI
jgi:hypothetical protein